MRLSGGNRAVVVALTLVGVALGALMLSDTTSSFLVLQDRIEIVDAAVVLAGDPDYERTSTGAGLLLAGRARLLVLTGGQSGGGDSAESLRAWAVRLGVPADRIRLESVSHSTWESLVAVRPILEREGARTVALVTSPYHQRRAYLAARRAIPNVTILNYPATPSSWSPEHWWASTWSRRIVLSEYAKLAYYGLRGWI
jgi:uncharacterized SAM-binding protein YcdF (DUF218 family)